MRCLFDRAFRICTNWKFVTEEFEHIKSTLLKNGYPLNFIDSILHKYLSSTFECKLIYSTVPKKDIFLRLPFFGFESFRIKKDITKLIHNAFPQVRVCILFERGKTLGDFFPFKDQMPKIVSSGIVYRVQCEALGLPI